MQRHTSELRAQCNAKNEKLAWSKSRVDWNRAHTEKKEKCALPSQTTPKRVQQRWQGFREASAKQRQEKVARIVDNKSATRSATERRAGEKGIQSVGGGTYGCLYVRAGTGRPTPTLTLTLTLTRPDPEPDLLISPIFFIFFYFNFFFRSHISKNRLLLCTLKFSVMNF